MVMYAPYPTAEKLPEGMDWVMARSLQDVPFVVPCTLLLGVHGGPLAVAGLVTLDAWLTQHTGLSDSAPMQ